MKLRHQLLLSLTGTMLFGAASAESLSLAAAEKLIAAARAYAASHAAPGGAIAIVDDGGHLLAAIRLDGTFPAASDVAIGKARTAALFRKPTRELEAIVNGGRVTMTTLPAVTGFTPLQGGIPISHAATVIGAIGVSGAASAAQDEEIAQAAASALSAAGVAR